MSTCRSNVENRKGSQSSATFTAPDVHRLGCVTAPMCDYEGWSWIRCINTLIQHTPYIVQLSIYRSEHTGAINN